jgi:hypothetical protein
LRLHAAGLLDAGGVMDVAREIGLPPSDLAASFAAADAQGVVARGRVGSARRRLVGAGLMVPVARGGWFVRASSACARALDRPTQRFGRSAELPDYVALARQWSYRGRKEAVRVEGRTASAEKDDGEAAVAEDVGR